jgi:hypothetical protein
VVEAGVVEGRPGIGERLFGGWARRCEDGQSNGGKADDKELENMNGEDPRD